MGLGGIDLTNGGADTALVLKMGVDLTGTGETAAIRIYEGSAESFSEALVPLPITDGTATSIVVVPFSDFVGGVTPDDVDAIQLIVGGNNRSIDAQFDIIGTVGARTHDFAIVPEPASIIMILCGLACLPRCRRLLPRC
jgi:hypothetical protein